MQRFGFLYGGYSFQYWETVDMMRKLLIGAIPVFVAVQPQGSLQAVIGQVAALQKACPGSSLHSQTTMLTSMMCLYVCLGFWVVANRSAARFCGPVLEIPTHSLLKRRRPFRRCELAREDLTV